MRHDHTDWLIHFVRDRVPAHDYPFEDDSRGSVFVNGEIEPDASAFSVFKTVVRLGGIIPGHSYRNGRTTIYGDRPVVCATEMPIYSFATYVRERAKSESVSAYGIAFKKNEFFAAGGRPAIYGLSKDFVFKTNTPALRILDESVLPLHEQYRYVAYSPSPSRWIDWTHEREWRWAASGDERDKLMALDEAGYYDLVPALPLLKGRLEGGHFSKLCFIVGTRDQADEIRTMLTGFFLAGWNNYDTPFDKDLISRSRIIVLDEIIDAVEKGSDINAQTIEGIAAANLLEPIELNEPPANADKLVGDAITKASVAARQAADDYASKFGVESGACGFADSASYEVNNPIIQYMLSKDLASGPFDGKVWIKVPKLHAASQSLDYNEAAAEAAAEVLATELGLHVFVDSRLD